MRCICCGQTLPVGEYPFGCDHCRQAGTPSSVTLTYGGSFAIDREKRGMARYASMLPYTEFVTLGEGDTPLLPLDRLAADLGLRSLYSKNEFQNPTGSHKDRMNPFIVERARELGVQTVAAASSGNEGVSLACYAAAAGLRCAIVATRSIAQFWQKAIVATGAELVLVDRAIDRWTYIRERVDRGEWYSATNMIDPPVGSCCYGLQGYKTIAYELYEQMPGALPDYVMVPVARGDLLWGIYEGFADLKRFGKIEKIPALVAVEPVPRIACVERIEDCGKHYPGDLGVLPSIGGDTVTIQSMLAVRQSGGFGVGADQSRVAEAVDKMAHYGLYLEESSAISIACLEQLLNTGKISRDSSVVLIATSHGFKNIL